MQLPTITVAMPNFNMAELLVRAMDAVLGQTVRPTEFLIIDDGSTDGSLDVIRDYQRRHDFIRLIAHERNMGVVHTAHELCMEARSDYVIFAASDDQLMPECLEVLARMLVCDPQAAFAFGNPVMVDEETGHEDPLHMLPTMAAGYLSPIGFARMELLNALFSPSLGWMPMHCAVIRTDLLRDIWVDATVLKWHADLFLMYVLALRKGACYWPKPLVRVRTTPNDFSKAQHTHAEKRVVMDMWNLLQSERYADIRDLFLKTNVFRHFATAWQPLIEDPDYIRILISTIP